MGCPFESGHLGRGRVFRYNKEGIIEQWPSFHKLPKMWPYNVDRTAKVGIMDITSARPV